MAKKGTPLSRFMKWSSKEAGKPIAFVFALIFIMMWLIVGVVFGFNDWWMLFLNTAATVNASLMVFIIQNTQNRENKALHHKVDELIRVTKEAERSLIAIEEKEEGELEKIRERILWRNTLE